MRKINFYLIILVVLGTVTVATINVTLNSNAPVVSNLTLQNMAAFTDESSVEWGCAGVPTHIRHKTLKSRVCIITFWRTHLSCKSENNVCCDPAKQTDCNGSSRCIYLVPICGIFLGGKII
jgi:hypothetical protein